MYRGCESSCVVLGEDKTGSFQNMGWRIFGPKR